MEHSEQQPAPGATHWAEDLSAAGKEEFDMFFMKVSPCPKRCVHDWSLCPFAHCGEKARRRDPNTHTGIACVSMKQEGTCSRGDRCPHAHSAWEYWLHPTRYHTAMCSQGAACSRKFCFFAHDPSELRKPSVRPGAPPALPKLRLQQQKQAGPPSSSSSLSSETRASSSDGGGCSLLGSAAPSCSVPANLPSSHLLPSNLHQELQAAPMPHANLPASAAATASASWGVFGSSGFGSSGFGSSTPLAPPSPPPGASASHSYPSQGLDLPPSPTPAQLQHPTSVQLASLQSEGTLSGPAAQAVIQALVSEVASGRLASSTAASMLNRLLPQQALLELAQAGSEVAPQPQLAAQPLPAGGGGAQLQVAGQGLWVEGEGLQHTGTLCGALHGAAPSLW